METAGKFVFPAINFENILPAGKIMLTLYFLNIETAGKYEFPAIKLEKKLWAGKYIVTTIIFNKFTCGIMFYRRE